MSIFSKVRTIALSNLHTVLDRAINLNSVGAVEQHVRDLEAACQDLEGTLAEARFDLRTKRGNLQTHETHAERLTADIRTLMNGAEQSAGNQSAARQLAGQLATLRETISTDNATILDATEVEGKLAQAVSAINAKETEMKARVGALRATAASTQAKNRAASALDAVGNAIEAGGSIDCVADKIGREGARGDAKFDRALGGVPVDPAAVAKADAILAELTGR